MSLTETLLPLTARRSTINLRGPAPDDAELAGIFAAAMRAPDHGRLRPWRFVVVRGAGLASLADLLQRAWIARDPNVSPAWLERTRSRILGVPMLIALGTRLTLPHAIPESEQVLSVGAAGMNLINALHMGGYGGMWVTGGHAHDPTVNAAFGFTAPNRLAGLFYVGTPVEAQTPAAVPPLSAHVAEWVGVDSPPRPWADTAAGVETENY